MFDGLGQKFTSVFDKLKRKGMLRADDIDAALREIRVALLEADVALPAVRHFMAEISEKAKGQTLLRSVTPGQQMVKIVHDGLVSLLAGVEEEGDIASLANAMTPSMTNPLGQKEKPFGGLQLAGVPPSVILMVGLQGSGKTTSAAKLALRFSQKDRRKVMLASLDTRRPAAQEQLKLLAERANVGSLPIIAGETPLTITRRATEAARLGGYDILILDSAGRLHIDDELMGEIKSVSDYAKPRETLLVVDAMTGQDAARVGEAFHQAIGVSGIILTRIDGDARGGAALSMRYVTGKPIRFLGVGEKLEDLDGFDADRLAGRILGMGDVVALVEKASQSIQADEAERLAKRMQQGKFDLNDMATQLKQMRSLGGVSSILGLLPGMSGMMNQLKSANLDEKIFRRQEAIISSMTKAERSQPEIIHASRRKRIAAGSGTGVADVNKLLKQHQMMEKTMKMMKKSGGGLMGGLGKMMGIGRNEMPDASTMAAMMGGKLPDRGSLKLPNLGSGGKGSSGLGLGGLGGMGGLPPGLTPGLKGSAFLGAKPSGSSKKR